MKEIAMKFRYILLSTCSAAILVAQSTSPTGQANSGQQGSSQSRSSTGNTSSTHSGSESSSSGKSASSQDKNFVRDAAKGGHDEVARATMMASSASNPEVKSFAQKLVTDHTMANQELEGIAKGKGMTMPEEKAKSGNAKTMSDKSYLSTEVQNHQKTIQLFEKESTSGSDPELKAFASKMLPGLRDHLAMAKSLQSGSNSSTTGDNKSGGSSGKGSGSSTSGTTSSGKGGSSNTGGSTSGTTGGSTSGTTGGSTSGTTGAGGTTNGGGAGGSTSGGNSTQGGQNGKGQTNPSTPSK